MQKPFSIADKIPEECLEVKGNIWKTEVHFQGYIPSLTDRKDKARRLWLYLFKGMDDPTAVFFLVANRCDLWAGHPGASLVPSPSSTTPHSTTASWRHCGVGELELSSSDWQTDSSKTQGWLGLSLQVDDSLLERPEGFLVKKNPTQLPKTESTKNIFIFTIPHFTVCLIGHFGMLISGHGRKPELRLRIL